VGTAIARRVPVALAVRHHLRWLDGAIGLASSRDARAQSRPGSELRLEVETEYLWPSKIDREIDTGSGHLVVGWEHAWFGWRAGATATYASGHIIQS
jgi:hypothetical protein